MNQPERGMGSFEGGAMPLPFFKTTQDSGPRHDYKPDLEPLPTSPAAQGLGSYVELCPPTYIEL